MKAHDSIPLRRMAMVCAATVFTWTLRARTDPEDRLGRAAARIEQLDQSPELTPEHGERARTVLEHVKSIFPNADEQRKGIPTPARVNALKRMEGGRKQQTMARSGEAA